MRKFTFVLVAVMAMFVAGANAQSKGDMHVGGNLGLRVASATTFTINPEFGYFVADNIKAGVELGFTTGSNRFTVMPNGAYYLRIVDNLYYTPGVAIGASFASGASSFNFDLRLGAVEFQPVKNMALSLGFASLNYTRMHKANSFVFDLLTAPSIGFRYYF